MTKLIIKHTYNIIERITVGEMCKRLSASGGDLYCMLKTGGKYFIESPDECHLNDISKSWGWIQMQNQNKKMYIVSSDCDTESFLT